MTHTLFRSLIANSRELWEDTGLAVVDIDIRVTDIVSLEVMIEPMRTG